MSKKVNTPNTMFIAGEFLDINNISVKKIDELLDKLQKQLTQVKMTRDNAAENGMIVTVKGCIIQEEELTSQMTTLTVKKFEIISSREVEKIVAAKKASIETAEELYGVKGQHLADDAVRGYSESLTEVGKAYQEGQVAAMILFGTVHGAEIKTVGALALKNGMEKGMEKAGITIDELEPENLVLENGEVLSYTVDDLKNASIERVALASQRTDTIRAHIGTFPEQCTTTLGEVSKEDTSKQQALVPKNESKNPFSKAFQSLRTWTNKIGSRINGKEKFEKNVVKTTEEKTEGIKKMIPVIKNFIKGQLIDKMVEICVINTLAPVIMQKATSLMPFIERGVAAGTILLTTSTAAQVATISALMLSTGLIAKIVAEKMHQKNKEKQLEPGESAEIENAGDSLEPKKAGEVIEPEEVIVEGDER